jgi:hypothetical protein
VYASALGHPRWGPVDKLVSEVAVARSMAVW